jgi:hypothetical protein
VLALVALVAPVLALAIWPWMWSNTAAHLLGYWVFIRDHAYQGVWYLGSKWNMPITPGADAPLAPWHYPVVMLVVATPPLTLLAALAGVLWTAWRIVSERGRAPAGDVLALLMVIGPLAAASLPDTPKYDGERLFFPAFAPLLLLVARLDIFHGDPDAPASWRRWRLAIPAVLVAGTAFSLATFGHRGLLYTNEAIRAVVPRGEDFPFEVSYWQETITPAVVDDIMALAGTETVRVKTLALHDQVFDVQRRWGRLPAGFVTGGPPPYDYHLVQNRRGFWMRSEWSLRLMREPLLQWPNDAAEPALYLFDGAPPLPLPEETVRLLEQR